MSTATTKRPRGFVPWNPRCKTRDLLTTIDEILAELSAVLPITLRQLFYRLVAKHDFENDPDELNDLSGSVKHQEVVKRLRAKSMSFSGTH